LATSVPSIFGIEGHAHRLVVDGIQVWGQTLAGYLFSSVRHTVWGIAFRQIIRGRLRRGATDGPVTFCEARRSLTS
jgi:hypothetical protein